MARSSLGLTGAPSPTPTAPPRRCGPFNLPSGGVLSIPGQAAITLTQAALYRPPCPTTSSFPTGTPSAGTGADATGDGSDGSVSIGFSDFRDHFYASIFPQCYALAATTVIAYTLVIMLFITPRSFLDGGVLVLGRRGFTSGGSGGTNIGGRPWLQKWAATFVAISLTIATANTFRVAEEQYAEDIENAALLQQEVLGGTELKVMNILSEAFLWLAQAQTLTRLFPRQREKVIIKWTAFALIALGAIFDSLNSFIYTDQGAVRPRSFTYAIPALSYLFQLSLGLLYAAWVLYYAIMKKQYAFYHKKMRNICLVAVLSIVAILVPVIFFILDISKPDFTGWGDYVRWVGGAAASVFVWEWVERIEALEREEKKDGILGREVFDGDEMLEMTSAEFTWPRKRRRRRDDDVGGGVHDATGDARGNSRNRGGDDHATTRAHNPSRDSDLRNMVTGLFTRRKRPDTSEVPTSTSDTAPAANPTNHDRQPRRFLQPPLWPARPANAATPVSRTDTASADSTVYMVRYDPGTDTSRSNGRTPPLSSTPGQPTTQGRSEGSSAPGANTAASSADRSSPPTQAQQPAEQIHAPVAGRRWPLKILNRDTGDSKAKEKTKTTKETDDGSRWDIRGRFEDFAATKAEQLREKMRPTVDTDSLPVTIIPAPPRRGAALAQLLEEEEQQDPQPRRQTQALPGVPAQANTPGPGPSSPPLWRPGRSSTSTRNGMLSQAGSSQGAERQGQPRVSISPPADSGRSA